MQGTESTYYEKDGIFRGSVRRVMGTFFEMVVVGSGRETCLSLWREVCGILECDESVMNRFDPSSEVSAVNLSLKDTGHAELGGLLAEAVRDCFRYSVLTEGLFDVTRKDMLNLSLEGDVLTSMDRSVDLDFGGFAKGWALKKIQSVLKDAGVETAFIDFGGSALAALGDQPGGEGWRISLPSPFDGSVVGSFVLKDKALSTSGNTPGYTGHIIDPRTGEANVSKMLTTVICEDPVDAEVLSTVLMLADDGGTQRLAKAFPGARFEKYTLG